ncbi:MAG: glycosyltransferase, partial [Candidatus Methylomirabilia bacterium]
NAFQTRADVIIAKSLREGFGLAVTGAGYHAKPRIVSQIGGLPAQVTDERGRAHAYLVGGTPHFSREASVSMTRDWLVKLLSTPRLRRALGEGAKRHVIRAFLPHRHLADYLTLFLELRVPAGRHAELAPRNGKAGQLVPSARS